VRYPVVLFDLDGTVIDTGAIILASMRHAAETVLGGEYSDAQLLAAVGGPGLEAQMHALDPSRVDELVRVYREHNEPLHDTIATFGGDETTEHKPHPAPLLLALERLGEEPANTAYIGDSPFDMQAAKAAGLFAVGVSWGRIHTADKLSDADVVVHEARELLDLV